MARHRAPNFDGDFIPGDVQLIISTTYGSDGVTVHLTDWNSEIVLASSEPVDATIDSDEQWFEIYRNLIENVKDAAFGS